MTKYCQLKKLSKAHLFLGDVSEKGPLTCPCHHNCTGLVLSPKEISSLPSLSMRLFSSTGAVSHIVANAACGLKSWEKREG